MSQQWEKSVIAFGGNQGNVPETYARVLTGVQKFPHTKLVAQSQLYTTAPVGAQAGDMFLNAAFELETALSAEELLDHIHGLEKSLGRERIIHWGPRIVDLDIITFGQQVISSDRLNIPHPAAWYRRFVLDPLVEIAGETLHPIKKVSFSHLKERLQKPSKILLLAGGNFVQREDLEETLDGKFPEVQVVSSHLFRLAMVEHENRILPEPTITFWLGGDDPEELELFHKMPHVSQLDLQNINEPLAEFIHNVIRSFNDQPRPIS